MLLVVRPGAPSSVLLVAMPFVPSSPHVPTGPWVRNPKEHFAQDPGWQGGTLRTSCLVSTAQNEAGGSTPAAGGSTPVAEGSTPVAEGSTTVASTATADELHATGNCNPCVFFFSSDLELNGLGYF